MTSDRRAKLRNVIDCWPTRVGDSCFVSARVGVVLSLSLFCASNRDSMDANEGNGGIEPTQGSGADIQHTPAGQERAPQPGGASTGQNVTQIAHIPNLAAPVVTPRAPNLWEQLVQVVQSAGRSRDPSAAPAAEAAPAPGPAAPAGVSTTEPPAESAPDQ